MSLTLLRALSGRCKHYHVWMRILNKVTLGVKNKLNKSQPSKEIKSNSNSILYTKSTIKSDKGKNPTR